MNRHDEIARRSRWMIRVMEWDDDKARYPNVWTDGMPTQILSAERAAGRLRLGDLMAIYYPSSRKHADRSETIVGLSRVAGLRAASMQDYYWVDLATAWKLDPPLKPPTPPRRVFMCCDPDWSEPEVALFQEVFDTAVIQGFRPHETEKAPAEPVARPIAATRHFGGVSVGGDMRDPKEDTWLATLESDGERLAVVRLEATARHGLQTYLRDPDRSLMEVEAIGMDFPFGLPLSFAESLLEQPYPEEGWWGFARKLERLSRPDYLVALEDFRAQRGEARRLTDDRCAGQSPLERKERDRGSSAFYGIRMIAEDRSRYAVRPFESARGKLLLEVNPRVSVQQFGRPTDSVETLLQALANQKRLPLVVGEKFKNDCSRHPAAFDAVVAARCAANAVIHGEVDKSPDELAPGAGDRVRREGWIYGAATPSGPE